MRIVWHSNHPDDLSGYGRQTALWLRMLSAAGHDMAVSAFHAPDRPWRGEWEGIPVFDSRDESWGADALPGHVAAFKPDLVITLMDVWALDPRKVARLAVPVACWMPIDCAPLGVIDHAFLEAAGAHPVAMSRHGAEMLAAARFSPSYVPHAIDTALFRPPSGPERETARASFGIEPDMFVIGINAANIGGHTRKGFAEQLAAFAKFSRRYPRSLLMLHTVARNEDEGGLDLWAIVHDLGIARSVLFRDEAAVRSGSVTDAEMAGWYGCLDLLSACSYGEGFCLPVLEAQACGVPAVATGAAAMRELAVWQCDSQPWWNALHRAWWACPRVDSIARRYQVAAEHGKRLAAARVNARACALQYEVRRVLEHYWVPALERLAAC